MTSSKKLSPNEPCPCGSGRKYKKCCWKLGFEWRVDDRKNLFRSIPLDEKLAELFNQQRAAFVEKHGREPGPDDPVFEPGELPSTEEYERTIVNAIVRAKLPLFLAYAFLKTALLVSTENEHLVPQKDIDEWNAACAEFEQNKDAIMAELGGVGDEQTIYAVLRLRAGPRHPLA